MVDEKKAIKKQIEKMDGVKFENYLYYLFLSLGYKVELTPTSNDFGADLIIEKDKILTVVFVNWKFLYILIEYSSS